MAKKLLLADDSVTVQRVIELTFADEGMQVISVGSGREAIARFESDRPDIVLADANMPDGDGYEVASRVKAIGGAEVPVVLMTGAFEQLDEARARSVGCDGVLAKPFEPQMAIALVRDLLEREPGQFAAAMPAADPFARGEAEAAFGAPVAGSIDDYFDQLDEALSSAGYVASDRSRLAEARGGSATPRPIAARAGAPPASLAEAFSALLADELGEAPLPESWRTAAAPRAEMDEAFVDEVARRVAERLSDAAIRETVERRVLALAEELIREEIDRIKSGA